MLVGRGLGAYTVGMPCNTLAERCSGWARLLLVAAGVSFLCSAGPAHATDPMPPELCNRVSVIGWHGGEGDFYGPLDVGLRCPGTLMGPVCRNFYGGIQFGSMCNIVKEDFFGIAQICWWLWGPSWNTVDGDFYGLVQAGPLSNETKGSVYGLQVGLVNVAGNSKLLQLGVVNWTAETACTMQVGVVNRAEAVRGIQIGVVNKAKNLKGAQIGVVNIAENSVLPYMAILNVAF